MNTLFVTNYLSVRTIIREDIICGMQGTEKLINRAKRGDKDAFGKIYEIFGTRYTEHRNTDFRNFDESRYFTFILIFNKSGGVF